MNAADVIQRRAEMAIAAAHIFRSAGGICPTFELPAEVCEAAFAMLDHPYCAGELHVNGAEQSRWWSGVTGGHLVSFKTPPEPVPAAEVQP